MRPSASATKRIAAPSYRTQHRHHTSLRSPYPSAPIQATPNVNPMVREACCQTRSRNVSEVEHDTDHQGRGPAHCRQHCEAARAVAALASERGSLYGD